MPAPALVAPAAQSLGANPLRPPQLPVRARAPAPAAHLPRANLPRPQNPDGSVCPVSGIARPQMRQRCGRFACLSKPSSQNLGQKAGVLTQGAIKANFTLRAGLAGGVLGRCDGLRCRRFGACGIVQGGQQLVRGGAGRGDRGWVGAGARAPFGGGVGGGGGSGVVCGAGVGAPRHVGVHAARLCGRGWQNVSAVLRRRGRARPGGPRAQGRRRAPSKMT
jgi:hypothetical protein